MIRRTKATVSVPSLKGAIDWCHGTPLGQQAEIHFKLDAEGLTLTPYVAGRKAPPRVMVSDTVMNHAGIGVNVRLGDLDALMATLADGLDADEEVILTYTGMDRPIEWAWTEIDDPFFKLHPIPDADAPADRSEKPRKARPKKAPVPAPNAIPPETPTDSPAEPVVASDAILDRLGIGQAIRGETQSIIGWTTAPADYDGFGTETLDPAAGTDDRKRLIRKVAIRPEHYEWQTQRYGSGMHVFHTEATVDDIAGGKYPLWTIAELAPPKPARQVAKQSAAPANGEVPEAAPCNRCGTTKGWVDRGVHVRIRGFCKGCYMKHERPGAGGESAPRQARSKVGGNGFILVGDRLINLASITYIHGEPGKAWIGFNGHSTNHLVLEGEDAGRFWLAIADGAINLNPAE